MSHIRISRGAQQAAETNSDWFKPALTEILSSPQILCDGWRHGLKAVPPGPVTTPFLPPSTQRGPRGGKCFSPHSRRLPLHWQPLGAIDPGCSSPHSHTRLQLPLCPEFQPLFTPFKYADCPVPFYFWFPGFPVALTLWASGQSSEDKWEGCLLQLCVTSQEVLCVCCGLPRAWHALWGAKGNLSLRCWEEQVTISETLLSGKNWPGWKVAKYKEQSLSSYGYIFSF